jgi:hypothetical protein
MTSHGKNDGGAVTRSVARREATIDGSINPAVQYDTARADAHRAILDPSGRGIAQDRLAGPERYAQSGTARW